MRGPAGDLPIMLEDVSILAGEVTILDRLTLKIGGGAPTVLIGPNGAGKTTLLRVGDGAHPADARPHYLGRPHGSAAVSPRHHVPASGDAPAQRRGEFALRARRRRRAARAAQGARTGAAGAGRSRACERTAGAAHVRRRAAAACARPRAGARTGRAASRRADREPRSGRHQGAGGCDRAPSPRAASRW